MLSTAFYYCRKQPSREYAKGVESSQRANVDALLAIFVVTTDDVVCKAFNTRNIGVTARKTMHHERQAILETSSCDV